MGFGDKLKDLKQQTQEKVSENRGKIQGAVDAASVAVNDKTHGKYANKILKVNEKAGSALTNFAGKGEDADSAEAQTSEPVSESAPVADAATEG